MKPDIRTWHAIDAAWLNAVLAQGGIDADVRSFTAKRVGTGQIGDCVRFALDYVSAPPDAPRSLVGKFPSESAESRETGISLGNYHREVKFYQLLQKRAGISTPHCYFSDVNEGTHEFVLMMEDLAPAEQGDQLTGVDIDTAMRVVVEAARLHAAFWEDETLDDLPWVSGSRDAPNPIQPELVAALWTGFVERYGKRITPEARRIGDAMSVNLDAYQAIREGARTMVHADFRPDNMLFATTPDGRPVTVVDWQSFGYGPGAADVGYFVAGALPVDLRRAHEALLLRAYTDELEHLGAGPYPPNELIRHYIAGAFQHFFTAYFAAMLVTQTPRGDEMFFKMLNGAVDLIKDHGAESWLD
jgi:aminoglycoside/choline kinase family phosphotransferase